MDTLIVRVKNVFGNNKIYPVSQKSCIFAGMLGKKTLSPNDLHNISMLGFSIEFNNIPTEKTEPFNQNQYHNFQKFITKWNA